MPSAADLLIRNARIYTLDDARPWAEAIAIRGDRIAWVGADADAHAHVSPRTDQVDAGGRLALPGFVDSHNHVRLGSDRNAVQLAGASSLEEIRSRIASWLAAHPDAEWVEAEGFNYGALGGLPTARDLEGVTGGRPAIIYTWDVHNLWLNREALARFGIGRGTERVAFGRVELDPASGEPTGLVRDFAVMGLERRGHAALERVVPSYARQRQYERLCRSLDMAIGYGITTIVEPQNSLDDLALFERARREGRLRSRLVAALFHPPSTTDAELDAFADAARRHDDDRLRVGPLKLYIDDVIEPHTAAFFDPYANDPHSTGETFYDPGEFCALMQKLDARGFQTFTHAMGDRGIRIVLDAVEGARRRNGPRDARHQIVHVECPHPSDVPRFAELGVVPCIQPRHWCPALVSEWRAAVGPEREAWAAPMRSLHRSGASLAFSSDWNVAEMDPLIGIYAALTRADLDGGGAWCTHETVDLATALRAYTLGGARANFCEGDRGSLEAGKCADLVLLSRNLFESAPAEMLEARVELALVGGQVAHQAL